MFKCLLRGLSALVLSFALFSSLLMGDAVAADAAPASAPRFPAELAGLPTGVLLAETVDAPAVDEAVEAATAIDEEAAKAQAKAEAKQLEKQQEAEEKAAKARAKAEKKAAKAEAKRLKKLKEAEEAAAAAQAELAAVRAEVEAAQAEAASPN